MTAQQKSESVKDKRKVRNYLLDVGLQVRYTAVIVIVAGFLTVGLGYKMYDATRETSRIVAMTGQVDPVTAAVMQAQFEASDRVVLWGIVGFGLVLLLAVTAFGILITHKVAGPLHKISGVLARVRDNHLAPAVRALRKGDELHDFNATFKEMHDALRDRAEEDLRVLGEAISALEDSGAARSTVLEELRQLRKRKEESLEG